MINLFKIWKATSAVINHYGTDEAKEYKFEDYNGLERIDPVPTLYRELRFTGNFQLLFKLRSTSEGRDILWGRRFNDPDHVKNVTVKKLSDIEYLQSLPPNTLGGHLGNMFKTFPLDEVYNNRYKEEEVIKNNSPDLYGVFGGAVDDIRVNINRYLYLLHDPYHSLFRYDTSSMGEAAVQGVTYKQVNYFPMRWCGLAIALGVALQTKSLDPFRVYFEAERLGQRAAAKGLWQQDINVLLERDIEEIRQEFDIGVPVKYKEFCHKYKDKVKLDNIHPEYDDAPWDEADFVI